MQIIRFTTSYQEPYPLQLVGEQSYRDEIEEVTGYTGESEGINADDFIAQLILDDNNIHDPGNAVAVEINGKTVGYLSRGNAKKYRGRLKELRFGDVVGECFASVRGGFERKDGGIADFGVRLDLNLDDFKLYVPPPPRPVVQSAVPTPATPAQKPFIDTIVQWTKWAFDRKRWWKTLLFLFFVPPIIYGVLQGIIDMVLGK